MKKLLTVLAIVAIFGVSFTANAATFIGHWGFEEGSGSTAYDSSANALNGTISNAIYTNGKVGNYALDFNGSNSFVEIGYSPLLNPESISIALWFKPRGTQVESADILDKGHGQGTNPYYGGYVFQYSGSSRTIDTVYGNGATFPGMNTGGNYKDDVWHHIVAILGDKGMALYIDNVLIDSDSTNYGPIVANYSSLYFGRHRTLGRYFNGLIDDVQIYDGALTVNQVANIYNTGTVVRIPSAIFLLVPGLFGLVGLKRKYLWQ